MTTSEQINELAAAGAKAQAELKPAIKDSTNPAFRSKYAGYAAIMEAAKVYAKHGIAVWQDVQLTDSGVSVTTRLTHTSGQWMECGPFTVPLGKHDAHGVGSAATYAKRYALSAALGIASDEDDDGNTAAAQAPKTVVKKVPPEYEEWIRTLEATAAQGSEALKTAWAKSQPFLRKYLTDTDPGMWQAIKDHAILSDGVPVQ